MQLTSEFVTPVELTGFVRTALADLQRNQFTLSRWLPNQTIDDIDYRITSGPTGLAKTAKYRSYNSESPISGREGVKRVMGELPPISEKKLLEEYTRIRLRNLTNSSPVVDSVFQDAMDLVRRISARIELARGEALVNGTLQIDENGVVATVDYGRKPEHTVAPSIAWSDSTATPLSDLLAWKSTYLQTGVQPGTILTSDRVLQTLMRNEEFRALVATTAGTPSIVSQDAVNSALVAYGLPRIETYETQVPVDGVSTRVIPDDRVIFLPPVGGAMDQLGSTLWGVTAESMEPEFGLSGGDQAGIVSGSYHEKDPVAVWTKAAAISLPVLGNADLTLVADVFTA